MKQKKHFISPDWSAPGNVHAYTSLRYGGISEGNYASFNLAEHVGDKPAHVMHNRRLLADQLQLPEEPVWLQQTHSRQVVELGKNGALNADAAVAFMPCKVCVVLTADCLPILLCDRNGTRVAAVHGGWRGLASGIISETVGALQCNPEELLAWLGPAIGPDAYQVGDEVRETFLEHDEDYSLAFLPDNLGRWMANLYYIAGLQLKQLGIGAVYGGIYCSYTDTENFFSFRRNHQTGRMASLIWLQD